MWSCGCKALVVLLNTILITSETPLYVQYFGGEKTYEASRSAVMLAKMNAGAKHVVMGYARLRCYWVASPAPGGTPVMRLWQYSFES